MRKTRHQDIILTMQVFLFLGVALCLIADTSTKSVGSTRYNQIAKHGSPQTSIREPCITKDDCQNGAECRMNDDGKYCHCKPGTEGDICEKVPECYYMDCGEDAKCVYNVELEKAVCQCNEEPLSFDPDTKICKKTCTEDIFCKNGGNCTKNDEGSYCICETGTEGDFCDRLPECETKECGHESVCVYDVKLKRAVCRCKNPEQSFDPDNKLCKHTCNQNALCQNGGTCRKSDEGSYCVCETGTEGDFCDRLPECDNKECGKEALCVYDVKLKRAVCRCKNPEQSFDPDNKMCKGICEMDKNRDWCEKEWKICVADRDVPAVFKCVCRDGETEDDNGKCVGICEMDKNRYWCEKEWKICVADRDAPAGFKCVCKEGEIEDGTGKCVGICEMDKYRYWCEKEWKICVVVRDAPAGFKCVCKEGEIEDGTGKCVGICEMDKYRDWCEKEWKICVVDRDAPAGFKCVCKEGEIEDESGKCVECDCGENSLSCKYKDGKKVCDCYSSYSDNNGKCERCSCGRNSWSCNFEDGKKVCDCLSGYGDKNGSCEDCDCGDDTFSCEFKDGKKSCVCDFGFKDNNGKCETCECGNNSFSCEFLDGQKICNCHRFHGQKDGQCEICFCGVDIQSCRYNESGNKVCDCPEGYIEINGICEKILFPSTFTPTEITWNATRNSSVEHTSVFTTSYRNSTSSSTIRPTGADPCVANLCQNGGTCVIVDNKSKCLCKKPYLGILCETGPCDWNPCMNNGVCKIENEKVKCYCKEPFAGKFCESPIKLDAYVVTLVAASVFSAIVLIFVTCVLCQRCRIVGTS